MANTSIKSLYNPFSNPSGGATFNMNIPANSSGLFGSALGNTKTPLSIRDLFNFGATPAAAATVPSQPTPVVKAPVVAPVVTSPTKLFSGAGGAAGTYKGVPLNGTDQASLIKQMQDIDAKSSGAAAGSSGPTGATGGAAVPPQWLKPDGTFYTPEEVTKNIEAGITSQQSGGDVGKLAGDQFSPVVKSAADLATDTRSINNARNDISTGTTDPYNIASNSGIQYTPQELGAIEKAYAGVYDPALSSAMSKLEDRQKKDAAEADLKAKEDLQKNAPYTLGKDEVRYGSDGKPIAVGVSNSSSNSGVYTPGVDPTADAFVQGFRDGKYKASDIPDQYKTLVAQGIAQTQPTISPTSKEAVSIINDLIGKGTTLNAIAGIPGISSYIPGTDAQAAKNLAKQLAGTLSLANRQQLKGQGAISDFEFKVLGDAATHLGIDSNGRSNLSNEEFVKQLNQLKTKLEVGQTSLTDDEVQHLIDLGHTPDEIRSQYGPNANFKDVGNTKVSTNTSGKNVPQRNNNPGNVKSGGLADALAIGTDNQGHLVFSNPIDGFKALTLDLTAKVNGGSSHLPANPTIGQLAKVYAEDPNWGKSVAKLIGVPVDTPTQSIPITILAQAVAKQEGFYA